MRIDFNASIAGLTLTVALFALPSPVAAQTGDYFAGKTLRVIVGLEAGGTADVFIRGFSAQLRKHIPGNPTVVVQNMTGAGGSVAANYTYERAAPDGLTIVFNTFHPLAQALGDPTHAGALRPVRICRRDRRHPRQLHAGRRRARRRQEARRHHEGRYRRGRGAQPFRFQRHARAAFAQGPRRQIQAGGGLSRRQRYLPRHAARRGAFPQHQHRHLPHPQRRLHQVGRRARHQLSRAGRCQRQLRTQQARHRDAGLSRPLQGNPRQAARRQGLGGLQLAHQPGRRACLHRAGAAQSRRPRRSTRCASGSSAPPTTPISSRTR